MESKFDFEASYYTRIFMEMFSSYELVKRASKTLGQAINLKSLPSLLQNINDSEVNWSKYTPYPPRHLQERYKDAIVMF